MISSLSIRPAWNFPSFFPIQTSPNLQHLVLSAKNFAGQCLDLSLIRQFEIKQNFIQFINKNMAKISDKEMIRTEVKTMETRYSASTLMKNSGVSLHFIKESLGHTSSKTTENYLPGFENEQKKEFSKGLELLTAVQAIKAIDKNQ